MVFGVLSKNVGVCGCFSRGCVDMVDRVSLTSMEITDEKRKQLKQLFPSVFVETQNEKGEPIESIDFEKLKAELGTFSDVFELRKERYGMDWPGKKDALKIIQQPSQGTLKPDREESVNFDTTENLFIEGDNLEVLKLLQKSYYGKVKMIYIDPPYNTGNEFIYPDKYSESLDTYLAYAGLVDGDGRKFATNTANEGRFHTKWLNMMYPRLYLARNLLRDDGVIFISIDDNEVSNLRKVCDEIYGEENFMGAFIWKRRQMVDSRAKTGVSKDHEYIVCYVKESETRIRGKEVDMTKYSNPDNDQRGDWMSADMTGLATASQRPNLHYDLEDPATGIVYQCPPTGWRYDRTTMSALIEKGEVLFPSDPNGRPRRKKFAGDLKQAYAGFSTVLDTVYNTQGTRELRALFDGAEFFDFPKPVDLAKLLLEQGLGDSDEGIVLDFFSGSATTAHAVLDLNKEDGGNRKFIMVQLPEPCDKNSEAYNAGYKTIADIGKERIRRVVKKIKEEATKANETSLPGMGEDVGELDLGFRVFKLSKSNFRVWDGSMEDPSAEGIAQQLDLHIDHVDPNASKEDILFEILIKAGVMPTEPINTVELAGKEVYSIDGGRLLICLEDEVTQELIQAMADAKPRQVLCLDRAFASNDKLKANAVQTFAALNEAMGKGDQIVFRTV